MGGKARGCVGRYAENSETTAVRDATRCRLMCARNSREPDEHIKSARDVDDAWFEYFGTAARSEKR